MHWETFYLICFVSGVMLSAVTLLGGMGHFGGHVHVPHVPHAPHLPHAVHVPHALGAAHGVTSTSQNGGGSVPWWNGFSIMIFLCWFGAAGYLLSKYGTFVAGVVLVLSLVCGAIGGAIIFFFLTKFLMPHERELTAEETRVEGALGRVSSTIRAGGTGEIVYEQLGARCSAPARSEEGFEIGREEEVFVVRYEKGIAYVRRWEDGLREEGLGTRDERAGSRQSGVGNARH